MGLPHEDPHSDGADRLTGRLLQEGALQSPGDSNTVLEVWKGWDLEGKQELGIWEVSGIPKLGGRGQPLCWLPLVASVGRAGLGRPLPSLFPGTGAHFASSDWLPFALNLGDLDPTANISEHLLALQIKWLWLQEGYHHQVDFGLF